MSGAISSINTNVSDLQTITNALTTINTGTNGYYIKLSNGLVIAFGKATTSSSSTGYVKCGFTASYNFTTVYFQVYNGRAAGDITSHITYANCDGSTVDAYMYKNVGQANMWMEFLIIGK